MVEGGQARLAVECDGDHWHGADRYEADMQRQRDLERCGWKFFSVRESAFYSNKDNALARLWVALEERGILSNSRRMDSAPDIDLESPVAEDEDETDDEHESSNESEADFRTSSRRPDEITSSEIQDAILRVLSSCPNQSCTIHSLASRVLKEVGVLTRGKPREEFEKRTMRNVSILEKHGSIETYKAKNRRLRLLSQGTA